MSVTETTLRKLDAAYRPFPTFASWVAVTNVDTVRWDRYKTSLLDRSALSEGVLNRARAIAKRAAALDTGAIEGLYEVDRGFTYTVAFETAAWEAALAKKGEKVRSLFEAQLHAYDYVLDLATTAEPLSEAAIRALHEEVCRAQETYHVVTAVGPQEQPLPKGKYKALPNHVRTREGTDHSYAPVDVTPAEMARFVDELRTAEFQAAHPVVQAAYAHYAFVAIHPFSDGNGRVARALASVFTYRAISMPIVILSEHKSAYLDALGNADRGEYQSFVEFMLARTLDTIKLVDESIRSGLAPTPEQSLAAINGLYVTRGGYAQEQVDTAGKQIFDALMKELQERIGGLKPRISGNVGLVHRGNTPSPEQGYRSLVSGSQALRVTLASAPPAHAQVMRDYDLYLPRDAGRDDDVLLKSVNPPDTLAFRVDEAIPTTSAILQMRIKMFVERLLGEMLANLHSLAEQSLRSGK